LLLTGSGFSTMTVVNLPDGSKADLEIISAESARFVLTGTSVPGPVTLIAENQESNAEIHLFVLPAADDFPVYTGPGSEVCTETQYYDAQGALQRGQKGCISRTDSKFCLATGDSVCLAGNSFRSINPQALKAENIVAGH